MLMLQDIRRKVFGIQQLLGRREQVQPSQQTSKWHQLKQNFSQSYWKLLIIIYLRIHIYQKVLYEIFRVTNICDHISAGE